MGGLQRGMDLGGPRRCPQACVQDHSGFRMGLPWDGKGAFGGSLLSSNPGLCLCPGEAGVGSGHRGTPAGMNNGGLGCWKGGHGGPEIRLVWSPHLASGRSVKARKL